MLKCSYLPLSAQFFILRVVLSYFIFLFISFHFVSTCAWGIFLNFSFSVGRDLEALLQVLDVRWHCATCKCAYKRALAFLTRPSFSLHFLLLNPDSNLHFVFNPKYGLLFLNLSLCSGA